MPTVQKLPDGRIVDATGWKYVMGRGGGADDLDAQRHAVWARDLALGKLISPAMKRPADQVLLRRNGEKWEDVGSYVGETVLLDESVRRQGLAEELVLRAAEHRPDDMSYLSEAGHSLLKRAHRLAVKRALARGDVVPEDVLADHPELKSR